MFIVNENNVEAIFEEEKTIRKKFFIIFGIGLVLTIIGAFIFTFLAIVGIGVCIFAFTKINSSIDRCKVLSANDAFARALSEDFEITGVSYARKYSVSSGITDGADWIENTGFETEVNKGFIRKTLVNIRPKICFFGKYNGIPFEFVQYKMLTQKERKEDVKVTWTEPRNFMRVKLKDDFRGAAYLTKGFWSNNIYTGYEKIETEDIEFNKMFSAKATSQLAGFRLFSPRHINMFKDFWNNEIKARKIKSLDLMFSDGFLITWNKSNSFTDIFFVKMKREENLKAYREQCKPLVEYIKLYIDTLRIADENYSADNKGVR